MEKKKSSAGGGSANQSDRATTAGKSSKSRKGDKPAIDPTIELNPEEEARLKAEQEERERLERERQIAEEKRNRERKIIELKNRELTTFYDLINEFTNKIDKYHKERRDKSKWLRYTRCDGSPDPVIPGEINTFLTLLLEDKDHNDIPSSLSNTNLSLELIAELRSLIDDFKTEIEVDNDKTIEAYHKTMKDLEHIIMKKFYETCYYVLLGASEKTDPETLNFDMSDGDSKLYYCIWANLSHNPKIKDFTFVKKHLAFVLPRQLTLSNVAICCVFTNFDLYSSKSRTYACRVKPEKFEFDPIPDINQMDESTVNREDIASALKSAITDAAAQSNLNEVTEDAEQPDAAADEENKAEEVKTDEPAKPEEETNKDGVTSAKSEHMAVIEEPHKKNMQAEEYAILQELSDSFVIDLRNYLPLGEIIHFGLFKIPPQPKKIRQWIITEKDNPPELSVFSYPSDPMLAQHSWLEYWNKKQNGHDSSNHHNEELAETVRSNMNITMKSTEYLESTAGNDTMGSANDKMSRSMLTKSSEQLSKLGKAEGPVQINYKIPPTVFFGETPQLARWDDKRQHWRTDEILEFKYLEDTHEIQFKTYIFPPFCLLQDRHIHMPFQLWRCAPMESVNNCIFTIETTSFELNIEIKGDQIRLFVPQRKQVAPESAKKANKQKTETTTQRLDYESANLNPKVAKVIEPIANKWFSLRSFIEAMRSIGLNIFPELDSEKFVTITSKDKRLERLVYRNMALSSCVVSYGYSKWNSEVNDDSKIIVLEQIHMSNKEPNPDIFKCLVFSKDLISLSNTQEMSEEFDSSVSEGTEEHADMYHMCMEELCKSMDKDTIEKRFKQLDELYFQTCLDFFESVKFLTFA